MTRCHRRRAPGNAVLLLGCVRQPQVVREDWHSSQPTLHAADSTAGAGSAAAEAAATAAVRHQLLLHPSAVSVVVIAMTSLRATVYSAVHIICRHERLTQSTDQCVVRPVCSQRWHQENQTETKRRVLLVRCLPGNST